MLIKEVILENFMSYSYARVPLKPGINVVVGPNGSGKSSFLLGICVALGESYTERSRKLSDLIRWDQDMARTTIILDNSPRGDKGRPAPQFDVDSIRLTRVLRRDGKYWFELNNKGVQRYEVVSLLSKLGFDSDNMLVIMHQDVPIQFAAISPQEKLHILERAVGFESFRADVLEARKRLGGILSEEASLNQLIDRAMETLGYWKEQNEKLQEKRNLQTRSNFAQRELAWSKVAEIEARLTKIEGDIGSTQAILEAREKDIAAGNTEIASTQRKLSDLRSSWLRALERRIELERSSAIYEYALSMSKDRVSDASVIRKTSAEGIRHLEERIEGLLSSVMRDNPGAPELYDTIVEIKEEQEQVFEDLLTELIGKPAHDSENKLRMMSEEVSLEVSKVAAEMETLQSEMDKENLNYVDNRVNLALLNAMREQLIDRVDEFRRTMELEKQQLSEANAEASIRGPRVETGRSVEEVLNEIRRIGGQLLAMANVSEEAEDMYKSYSDLFAGLQQKISLVRENRRKVMDEIDVRTRKWWEVLRSLLDQVNSRYQSLLEWLQATGEVRISNPMEIEEAGLELVVGFKGARQMTLDAYTHSGGERSTAIMAFLLALQQNIVSPFRAIDEFDVHMDPKNLEIVSDFIVFSMQGFDTQYLVITPSQVSFKGEDVHIVIVHRVGSVSGVSVIE